MYVVVSGYYSEYGIDAIFDDKELAENYISAFGEKHYDEMRLEMFELNPYKKELKPGRKAFRVEMDIEGNVMNIEQDNGDIGIRFYSNRSIICNCLADDKKHAVKIANEKRIQCLTQNRWGR